MRVCNAVDQKQCGRFVCCFVIRRLCCLLFVDFDHTTCNAWQIAVAVAVAVTAYGTHTQSTPSDLQLLENACDLRNLFACSSSSSIGDSSGSGSNSNSNVGSAVAANAATATATATNANGQRATGNSFHTHTQTQTHAVVRSHSIKRSNNNKRTLPKNSFNCNLL